MREAWISSRCFYLAGHASPVTTAKYDRRGEEVKRKAVQRLGF